MNDKIENILFPTDFSETANNALLIAINIAKRDQAALHLLHIIVPKCNDISFDRRPEVWQALEQQNKKGLKKLSVALEKQYNITVYAHTSISDIHAAECIEQFAERLNVDLIVMGTHGLSGTRDFFMGSNTYTVMRNVACPVLAIPVYYKKFFFRNILLPIRRTEEIEDKFKIVTRFLKSPSTRIEFLGVAPFTDFTSFDCLTNKINGLAFNLKNQGIDFVHRNEICEDIADFVLDYADACDAELLVINPVMDDDWGFFSLGPYTQKILNHTKKPVMCVKPETNHVMSKHVITTHIK
ncbi:universal stress protein [Emticicia sp. C21]|uniref:universal stress protein n=1 Tax=Emticicia sp. C21 TaxID=2302915 RepID=UPI000E352F36|nr:universal stress protein [Emticicia sp. C21]RFS15544.1 universal stress protein [Emticicia sp. C21]